MSLGFGIIGAGWIGERYKPAIDAHTGLTLIGASGNPSASGRERLRETCERWKCEAFDSIDSMVNDDRIDVVGVFSPTGVHFDQVMQCLEAGKHVLVEKPVALDVKEIEAIDRKATERGLLVFPGHNFVYRPVVRKAKEIVDSGALGTVSYASFRSMHFIPEEHATGWRRSFELSGGGAMIDSGTHLVYQSLYLLGEPVDFCSFSSRMHYREMDGEDTCVITAQYPSGAIATISQVWSAADPSAGEIRIVGDQGVLLISDVLTLNGEVVETDSGYERSFHHTVSALVEAVTGDGAPLSTLDDAAKTLGIIQRSYEMSPIDRAVRS